MFAVICCVVGTGTLQLPAATAEAGWIGLGLLCMMGAMATYTAKLLARCLDIIRAEKWCALLGESGREASSYGDIGEAAYGRAGRWFVTVQLHLTLVMVATIQHLLCAFTLRGLLVGALPWLTYPLTVLLTSAVLGLHAFLRTLADVAVISYVKA